jgi:hypothetical protein
MTQRDRPALRFWLGSGTQDCRRRIYARLRSHCEAHNLSPRAALELLSAGQLQLPYMSSLVDRYANLKQRLAAFQNLTLADLVDRLFPAGDYDLASLRQVAVSLVRQVASVSDYLRNCEPLSHNLSFLEILRIPLGS